MWKHCAIDTLYFQAIVITYQFSIFGIQVQKIWGYQLAGKIQFACSIRKIFHKAWTVCYIEHVTVFFVVRVWRQYFVC